MAVFDAGIKQKYTKYIMYVLILNRKYIHMCYYLPCHNTKCRIYLIIIVNQ
jgi:hypothetical protein